MCVSRAIRTLTVPFEVQLSGGERKRPHDHRVCWGGAVLRQMRSAVRQAKSGRAGLKHARLIEVAVTDRRTEVGASPKEGARRVFLRMYFLN